VRQIVKIAAPSQCLWRGIMDYVQPQIAMLPKRLKTSKKEVKKPPAGKVQRIRISQPAGASETQRMDGNSTMDIQSVPYCGRKRRYQPTMSQRLETPYDIRDEAMNDLPGRCFAWGWFSQCSTVLI
jgi:hypothetical protein